MRLAVASAVLVCLSGFGDRVWAQAQEAQTLAPVIVSASRVAEPLQTAPVGATVITADQIERSGVADANEAIRKLGGVAAKSDLNNGRENALDLRGYGETASSNMVVLVDGIRVSENEMASARLSAIPLDQIDRIEIIRGGSSVVWGEGASAGVINVILKTPLNGVSSGRLSASAGSFGSHQVQASGTWALNAGLSLEGSLDRHRSDGYRDNSDYSQDVASVGLQWRQAGWLVKARVQREDQDARLPGSLTLAQFNADPTKTNSPDDFSGLRETRYSLHLSREWGNWQAQVDLGRRERESTYQYVSYFGALTKSSSQQTQVSPRLINKAMLGHAKLVTVLGYEAQHWTFDKNVANGQETGKQTNSAWFIHSDLSLATGTRLTAGAREERVVKRGDYPGAGYDSPVTYDRQDTVHAAEFGINQTVAKGWDVYGRVASSYRLANVDENRLTPSLGPLRPQKNQDKEIGVKWLQGRNSAALRLFTQSSVDEIAFVGGTVFANTNIDPTRRQGIEIEGHWSPVSALDLSATVQDISAKYRKGPLAGRQMVLVAPQTATLRASYQVADHHTVDLGLQYLAKMRFGQDTNNQCARRVPSSTLLDARYAWSDKAWTVAVSGTNLTDKQGYNYAYSCTGGDVYPFAGRALKLTVSRQF